MNEEKFLSIVDGTPLVSIDLVLLKGENLALLGKRVNRPAQGFWFVPGGRIRKNELIEQALIRISRTELGVAVQPLKFLGVYDHIYDDNYHARPGINTHYVALGFGGKIDESVVLQGDDQHSELKWWGIPELLASPDVHENTKRYFRANGTLFKGM